MSFDYMNAVAPYSTALNMIRDAVEEMFGPYADLESRDAVLLRGPEPTHEAEAIIKGLQNVDNIMQRTFAFDNVRKEFPFHEVVRHANDGMVGNVRGYYVTREGHPGVAVQQLDTRIVHVYRSKWMELL